MTNSNNKPFAEIIESSLTGWKAQCWQWDSVPPFGSLVMVTHKTSHIFGITHHIETSPIDSSRAPFAYKKTEEELKRDHPQIFELLKTTFSCIIVGYHHEKKIRYQLATEPVKIHAFVQHTPPETALRFFTSLNWLHTFFGASNLERKDELLLAILERYGSSMLTQEAIDTFIEAYCLFANNEYRQTKLFLQRLSSFID